MGKISFKLVYALLLAVLFAGCSGGNEPDPITPQPLPDPDPIPQPQPESKGVVTDLSDPTKSGVTVEGYDYQTHSMLVKATADKAPKKGDYLVSGITNKTPFGFMLKTVEVEDRGSGNYAVYSVPATLNEVLKAKGITHKGWTKLTPVNTEGRGVVTPEKYTSLLKHNVTLTVKDGAFVKKDESKKDEKDDDPFESEIKLKIDNEISWVEGEWFTSDVEGYSGFKIQLYHSSNANLSGSIKSTLAGSKDLFNNNRNVYKSFECVVGAVPVVVTYKCSLKMPAEITLEAKGSVDIIKEKRFYTFGLKFMDENGDMCEPLSELGGNFFRAERLEDDNEQLPNSEYSASGTSVTLSGTLGLHLDNSIGLYGGNYTADDWKNISTNNVDLQIKEPEKSNFKLTYLTAGMDVGVDLKMDASVGREGPGWLGWSKRFSNDDERLKDTWSCSCGTSVTPRLILYELKYGIFESSVKYQDTFGPYYWWNWKGPLLYTDLKSLKLNVKNDGSLNISATLQKPLFGVWNETEYGVCIEKYGMTDLRMFKLTDRIKLEKDNKFTYNLVDASGKPVKLDSFESGATYAIYPYVKTRTTGKYIFRKGITFIPYEGGLKFNIIDDVPGVEL